MWLACEACDKQIICEDCGCSEEARSLARERKDKIRELENKIDDMQNALLIILDNIARKEIITGAKETDTFQVAKKDLERMWQAMELQWYEADSVDSFLSRQLMSGWVTIAVAELFRKQASRGKTYAEEVIPWRRRLAELKKSIDDLHDFHGWKNSMELTSEEVAWKISEEV